MRVQQLLKSAAVTLADSGVESSTLEAELLLRDCLGKTRSGLYLSLDQQIDETIEKKYRDFLDRRCLREPLQYILGSCEFWSLDFSVTPDVLIPRPETEFLLEQVLSVTGREEGFSPQKILDLCTGSGIIAVVLAREFCTASILAVDCSPKALAVAGKNINFHRVDQRINLLCSDLLSGLTRNSMFDIIVCNPPYVKLYDISGLEPEVRDWEPKLALSGGVSGMDIIGKICTQASSHLHRGGWLFVEIGADLEETVLGVFRSSGRYEQVRVVKDWAGNPRVLQAKFNG